jgi:hypothetical protein
MIKGGSMKKKAIAGCIIALISFSGWSFEWPQLTENTNSLFSWFGENRGSSFCSALIFSNASQITASDNGHILAKLGTNAGEDGWFEGSLGNAVILSHKNEMDTVYGNLETITLLDTITDVKSGDLLGKSGNSGWQKGKSCLEFQVLDTKLDAIINPLLLLQKKDFENYFYITNLEAKNQNTGESYKLSYTNRIPAGIYTLYSDSEPKRMPYSLTVSINGIAVETTTYDTLTLNENHLCVKGKRPHSFTEIYPEKDRFMVAEIILSHGKNTLSITTADSAKNEKTFWYQLEIQ